MHDLGCNRAHDQIADRTHTSRPHDDPDAIELFGPLYDGWRRAAGQHLAFEPHSR